MSFASISKSIVNIFILTIEQMTMCNVKGVASIDVPTENYHPTAVPLSSAEHFSIFQLIVFVFPACNFTVLVQSHCSKKAAGFSEKALINLRQTVSN